MNNLIEVVGKLWPVLIIVALLIVSLLFSIEKKEKK